MLEKLIAVLRTSEFWVAVITAIGGALVSAGVISESIWNNFVWPAVSYVIFRIFGKVARVVLPSKSTTTPE